jgi:hypothetical protein
MKQKKHNLVNTKKTIITKLKLRMKQLKNHLVSLLILFHIVEVKHGKETLWMKRVHLTKRCHHTKTKILRERMRNTIQTVTTWGK